MQKIIVKPSHETRKALGNARISESSQRQLLAFTLRKDKEVAQARARTKAVDKITTIVIARIERPKRLNLTSHLLTGNELTPKGNRVALSKVSPNREAFTSLEARLSKSSTSDNVYRRCCDRPDTTLSHHEREDVKSVVREVVLTIPFREAGEHVKMFGERLSKDQWKAIFRGARSVLGMDRYLSRAVSYESIMGDIQGCQTLELAMIESRMLAKRDAISVEHRARVAAKFAHHRKCLLAYFRANTSRKAKSAYKTMRLFSVIAARAALGEGLGQRLISYDATKVMKSQYLKMIASGEELLNVFNPAI